MLNKYPSNNCPKFSKELEVVIQNEDETCCCFKINNRTMECIKVLEAICGLIIMLGIIIFLMILNSNRDI